MTPQRPLPFLAHGLLFASTLVACSVPDLRSAAEDLDEPIVGPRCAVELAQVAAYQSVKVPLSRRDDELPRDLDLVAGKAALLRVFLAPTGAVPVPDVRVAMSLRWPGGERTAESAATTVTAASSDDRPGSTFDFPLAADELVSGASLSVEIRADGCAGLPRTRFPRANMVDLRAQPIGPLRVRVVPLRYDADGSGRLPDVSPEQLATLRQAALAMFPVPAVEIELRDPAPSAVAVSARQGWRELLSALRSLRARDRAPADVYYLGLVAPADSYPNYCGGGCTTGLSFVTGPTEVEKRASVSLGYSGRFFVEAMLHELGHAHGRAHAPCGETDQVDTSYPHPTALIGVWGYDVGSPDPLRSPERTRDIMSYCQPRWISDYTYRSLTVRSAQVNRRSF